VTRSVRVAKRLIDVSGACLGLLVVLPLWPFIALAIYLESPGEIFFRQRRAGHLLAFENSPTGGAPRPRFQEFLMLKFRSMRPDAEKLTGVVVASQDDPRITKVGKFLRKTRLDELPQFVNVIRGDMNLVGPRPHPVTNLELFGEEIPYYSLRAAVRPGITGWAQVRLGYANNLEEETEKMRYDLYYIKRLSFWLDLRILFDTVKIVIFGRGSQSLDAYRTDLATEATK